MKVILLQTVPKVGKSGTVVNVADGFARNYLFTKGLAIIADKNQLAALEKKNARVAAKSAAEKSSAETMGQELNGQVVKIPAQVGAAQGKLFGAITAQAIADAIKSQLGKTLERKQIGLIDPIKRLGNFEIPLDLHRDVEAVITVVVFDPTAPVETVKELATEAGA
jgi:large subunit ribosomal protein L9